MKFIKGYCPHCTNKVLMKSTAGRLTCPHCGKEYSTEEAYRLYESIKEEKQVREEEEIREKSVSYVNSTYESYSKDTSRQNNVANKSLVYGMGAALFILFIIGFSLLFFGENKESDLSETVRQETRARIETTESVTIVETEPATDDVKNTISQTDNESIQDSSLPLYDENGNTVTEYDTENNRDTDEVVDVINEQMKDSLNQLIQASMSIFRLMGAILMVFAIGQFVLAFKDEDADSKARAMMILVTATLLMSLPTVFNAIIV